MPVGVYERKIKEVICPICDTKYTKKQRRTDVCPSCLRKSNTKPCEVCGEMSSDTCGKDGKYGINLCSRHRRQMDIYGCILEITPSDPNEIIVYDGYAEIILRDKDGNSVSKTTIDIEDIDKVSGYRWRRQGNGYVSGSSGTDNQVLLHRFITRAPKNMHVDHINHDTSDNRKSNLRICTVSQNNMNRGMQSNNTSGYVGVHPHYGSWAAKIKVDGKQIHLGSYPDINDATEARRKAVEKYFGEFAYKPSTFMHSIATK